jgi:hypothetical protein
VVVGSVENGGEGNVLASGCRSWESALCASARLPTSETDRRGPTTVIQMLLYRRSCGLSIQVTLTVSCHVAAAAAGLIRRAEGRTAQEHISNRAVERTHECRHDMAWRRRAIVRSLSIVSIPPREFACEVGWSGRRLDHVSLDSLLHRSLRDPSTTTSPLASRHHHRDLALAHGRKHVLSASILLS